MEAPKEPNSGGRRQSTYDRDMTDHCWIDDLIYYRNRDDSAGAQYSEDVTQVKKNFALSPTTCRSRLIRLVRLKVVSPIVSHEYLVCEYKREDEETFFIRFDRTTDPPAGLKGFIQTVSSNKAQNARHMFKIALSYQQVNKTPGNTGFAIVEERSFGDTAKGPDLGECLEITDHTIHILGLYKFYEQNCWCYSYLLYLLFSFRLVGVVQPEEDTFATNTDPTFLERTKEKLIEFTGTTDVGELWTIGKTSHSTSTSTGIAEFDHSEYLETAEPSGLCMFIYNHNKRKVLGVVILGDRLQYPVDLVVEKTILEPQGLEEFLTSDGGIWLTKLSQQWKRGVGSAPQAAEAVNTSMRVAKSVEDALTKYLEQYLLPNVPSGSTIRSKSTGRP